MVPRTPRFRQVCPGLRCADRAWVSVADELAKLVQLRDAGVLSSAEFDAQKAKLLG